MPRQSTRNMSVSMRRKLSEEGRRLLRVALTTNDENKQKLVPDKFGNTETLSTDMESSAAAYPGAEQDEGNDSDDSDAASTARIVGSGTQASPARRVSVRTKKREYKRRAQLTHEDDAEEWEQVLEKLADKDDQTKIEALAEMLARLCTSVRTEDMSDATVMALTELLLNALKKKLKESGMLTLRAMSVLAITIGAEQQHVYEAIRHALARMLKDTDAGNTALRIEAAYALSIANFVCCREEAQTWELIDLLGNLLVAANEAMENGEDENQGFTEEFVLAMMECWAFLVSGFFPSSIVARLNETDSNMATYVETLSQFVRADVSPTVRSGACEVLALLVQFKYMVGKHTWSYKMEDALSPLSGLDDKIQQFMRESAKTIGKKMRKMQRSMLKEVLETLRTGEGPYNDLQIEGETLSLSTWSRYFQAHIFRRALQSGFQLHLHENPVLREVFEVSETSHPKISMIASVQRRADHRSKTMHKRNDMSRKDAVQNAFLYED